MKKTMRLIMLLSMTIVLNIIETFIPFFSGAIPGLKLGLPNIVILLILYIYGFKDALKISVLRVILVGILRTGLFSISFFFSLSGAILSVIFMSLFKKTKLSIIGVSVIGSIFHSIGQIIIAIILLKNVYVAYYLPWLLFLSIPTGMIIGYISKELINIYQKHVENVD